MARKKGPKYYSTEQAAATSIGEIQQMLSEFGVQSYHVLQEGGQPVAVAWVMDTPQGLLPFRFRPNIEGVEARFRESGTRSPRLTPRDVAWRQAQEMIELQLEIVESGAATFYDVFGGYALTSGGRTVSELIESGEGKLAPGESLLLQSPD